MDIALRVLLMMCSQALTILEMSLFDVQHSSVVEFLLVNMLLKQFLSLIPRGQQMIGRRSKKLYVLLKQLTQTNGNLGLGRRKPQSMFSKRFLNLTKGFSFYNSTLERWQLGKHCQKSKELPCNGKPVIVRNQNSVSLNERLFVYLLNVYQTFREEPSWSIQCSKITKYSDRLEHDYSSISPLLNINISYLQTLLESGYNQQQEECFPTFHPQSSRRLKRFLAKLSSIFLFQQIPKLVLILFGYQKESMHTNHRRQLKRQGRYFKALLQL